MIIGIAIIVLWALAKSFGIIRSPVWLEMIPVFGGAATLGGVGIAIGKVLNRVDRLVADVERLGGKSQDLNNRVIKIETLLKAKKPNSF